MRANYKFDIQTMILFFDSRVANLHFQVKVKELGNNLMPYFGLYYKIQLALMSDASSKEPEINIKLQSLPRNHFKNLKRIGNKNKMSDK